jgi:hypothetical protein
LCGGAFSILKSKCPHRRISRGGYEIIVVDGELPATAAAATPMPVGHFLVDGFRSQRLDFADSFSGFDLRLHCSLPEMKVEFG